MIIREAKISDEAQVRRIHLQAFDSSENELVAGLACDLLHEPTIPETIHLVAKLDHLPVGHVAFSPVWSNNKHQLLGYILAPLAVIPGQHKKGIGSALVHHGIDMLKQRGIGSLIVYGDPNYYGRFGFQEDLAAPYLPPYELEYPNGWQALIFDSDMVPTSAEKIKCVQALEQPELW
ncbi:N-acetyltransferase [Verrucomicrobiaceae bacterium N1E253]|uniref:N-acetyltransferase n=1 Tax=Oceaniferula marina TaxID=2748318 RepID=A0A851GC25_9BACT|nr:N-acetyltransferase [Oceaniferula marina]NWK55288.1 N-acetyltransferase [Oceaniferula marina]